MIDSSLYKAADTTLTQCLGLQNGEILLIVVNEAQLRIGKALFRRGSEITGDVRMVFYPAGELNGEEPPEWISDLMMDADVIVAATEKSISHTEARRRSSRDRRSRAASMPGITDEIFIRGMAADYDEIEALSTLLKPYFDKAVTAHITSPSGTDLSLKMGNAASMSIGKMLKPGDFSNLPDGETECAPVNAEGRLVVDRCGDLITEATEFIFREGYLREIEDSESGRRFQAMLDKAVEKDGSDAPRFIAEFAIGTNKKAKISGVVLEDEKVYGTCHVAIGDNTSYAGGNNPSSLHIDTIVFSPTIYFDEILIMKDGELRI